MGKRWLQFLGVWAVCALFYLAYRQWMAWVILVSVSCLPLFSLAVSLPAMVMARLVLPPMEAVAAGKPTQLPLQMQCPLPLPLWQARVTARHSLTGKLWQLQAGFDCPTEHCGVLEFTFTRCRVYDYMGLFFLPRRLPAAKLTVRPQPLAIPGLGDPALRLAPRWQPKAGGGLAENHELRLYRPGDSLRQVHWKASGKTGRLIYRESLEPAGKRLQLRLALSGGPEALDRKLGRLLWLARQLLDKDIPFAIAADTGDGPRHWPIDTPADLTAALDALLGCAPTDMDAPPAGGWAYVIGGEADEGL